MRNCGERVTGKGNISVQTSMNVHCHVYCSFVKLDTEKSCLPIFFLCVTFPHKVLEYGLKKTVVKAFFAIFNRKHKVFLKDSFEFAFCFLTSLLPSLLCIYGWSHSRNAWYWISKTGIEKCKAEGACYTTHLYSYFFTSLSVTIPCWCQTPSGRNHLGILWL